MSDPNATPETLGLYAHLQNIKQKHLLVYVMLWRNATHGGKNGRHFYTPHLAHASAEDFVRLKKSEFVLFGMSGHD